MTKRIEYNQLRELRKAIETGKPMTLDDTSKLYPPRKDRYGRWVVKRASGQEHIFDTDDEAIKFYEEQTEKEKHYGCKKEEREAQEGDTQNDEEETAKESVE